MTTLVPRIALHLEDGKRRILDPADIYWLEADGDDTWVRLRSSKRLRDRRALGVLAERLAPWHFVRIHRSHVVNPLWIREVRHQKGNEDRWEVKLATPVNRILPVGKTYLSHLWKSLGEG
jgi:DNA-binding LytR/AlgR family response regulator